MSSYTPKTEREIATARARARIEAAAERIESRRQEILLEELPDESLAGAPLEERIAAWIALEDERKALEERAKSFADRASRLEPGILEEMSEKGVDRMTIRGRTVYPKRELFASAKPLEELPPGVTPVGALIEAELFEFLALSPQRVSSYVRELAESETPLPESLSAVVRITERFRLRSRRA